MGWKYLITLITCLSLMSCGNSSPILYSSQNHMTNIAQPFQISRLSPNLSRYEKLIFQDDFEKLEQWQIFEEIVNNNPCYKQGEGKLEYSKDVARSGNKSLKVWSNHTGSVNSNHVIGAFKVSNQALKGLLVLETDVNISSRTYLTGQTGPEISAQITREISPGQYRTFTAGLQYQSNNYLSPGYNWAIWTGTHNPGKADWSVVTNQIIYGGQWYHIKLVFDLNSNQYRYFEVTGKDVNLHQTISQYNIVPEKKFTATASWISVESENAWSNCGKSGIYEHQVYYDNVQLKQLVLR